MMPSTTASVDPIISRLRPRSVVEILDQAFRLYRKHFLTFLAITAVIFVPVNALVQAATVALQGTTNELATGSSSFSSTPSNEQFITVFILAGLLIILGVVGGLLQYLSQGALTAAVADSYLERPVSFSGAYRTMSQHIGPLLGAIGLQVLIAIGIFAPIALIAFLAVLAAGNSGSDSGATAGICLAFCLIVPAFALYAYVSVRLSVAVPAIMVESLGPRQGLRRSWGLILNSWWRTAGLLFLLGIFNYIISVGPAALITGIAVIVTKSLDPVVINSISGAVAVLAAMFYIPLQLITMTLYYFDLRVRKEGFDLETAMQQRYWPQQPLPAGAGAAPGQYWQPSAGSMAPPTLGYGTQPQQPQQPQYPVQPEQPNWGGYSPPPQQLPGSYNPPDQQPDSPDSGEGQTRPMPPPGSQPAE
jgi:hypothetical protein